MKVTLPLAALLSLLLAARGWACSDCADRRGESVTADRDHAFQRGPTYAQGPKQSNRPQAQSRADPPDPFCPGKDNRGLMCRLVNGYREKHGLKPVQLDDAVSREAQYWSDQLNVRNACWFLYHDANYHPRMRARFPGRRFRENAACSGSTGGGAQFILQKWIDSSGHRENMLTPDWKKIGVGVTNNIWVIDFTN